jgi:prepilin-type N-terminal cleavage/methylation domain-containing protein
MNIKQKEGFTLIEILIVVAIIAILASVVLVGLGPTQEAGRDARRISDLSEVQNGLELYYNECGFYPGPAQAATPCSAFGSPLTSWSDLSASLTGTPGIGVANVPNDPSSGRSYEYGTDSIGSTYVLEATLENGGNSVFTGYNPPSLTGIANITSCASPSYCKTL